MKSLVISEQTKTLLATEVFRIRKNIPNNEKVEIDTDTINDILTPLRQEDNGNTLWDVFNVCQEKLIKGGFSLKNNKNKLRKQRNITSIKKDIDYNQKLWEFANNLLPTAIAA
jgi:hypothetical protein